MRARPIHLVALILLLPLAAPALAAPAEPPAPVASLDDQIGKAIERGAAFLAGRFVNGEVMPNDQLAQNALWKGGLDALCIYALLQAGQATGDPRYGIRDPDMLVRLEKLKAHPLQSPNGSFGPATYAHSFRTAALAVYDRREDREILKQDCAWLVGAETLGGYTYDNPRNLARRVGPNGQPWRTPDDIPWDNSNSQYGLLGAWNCLECGLEIPDAYWRDVEQHWLRCRHPDGQWGYGKAGNTAGSLSMTCAGIASLFVTQDALAPSAFRSTVGREPYSPALATALAWLEHDDNCLAVGGERSHFTGYDLFSVERVGLLSGFKYFGKHDWYAELAAQAMAKQQADGSWASAHFQQDSGTLIETAYHVLFLARGRHPILMNKLRFGGSWANRPRDLANFTRYAGRTLERPLNWQVVSFAQEPFDWLDSPVLYIASHAPPKFTDAEYDKLRQFVDAGGLIFTHADGGGATFNNWVPQLVRKICPRYELAPLPEQHEIYSLNFKLQPSRAKLQAVSNGSRVLIVHSPIDLSGAWEQRAEHTHADAFQLGLNLALYARGKEDLRNRLSSPYIPPPAGPAQTSIKLARLKYPGNWDPEPAAWTRFSRYLQGCAAVGVDLKELELAELKPDQCPVAHLTGNVAYQFTDAQAAALREYVASGGIVLIDACGGSGTFASAVEDSLLPRAFPGDKLERLATDQPPLSHFAPEAVDASQPQLQLRTYAARQLNSSLPSAYAPQMLRHGKGCVIWTRLDLTTGLVGANTWGILGYQPAYALDFTRNLLLWARQRRGQQ
jgi:hypothetical protein